MVDATLISTVSGSFQRRKWLALAIPVVIFAYLFYAAVSFDVLGVAARARMDNAQNLLSDFWSYKVSVIRDNRNGKVLAAWAYEGGVYADWDDTWIASLYADPWQFLNTSALTDQQPQFYRRPNTLLRM